MALTQKTGRKSKRVVYDNPSEDPQRSLHWKRIQDCHNGDDATIATHDELIDAFKSDVASFTSQAEDARENYQKLALWSCVMGYCEALATHKDTRYCIFPVPLASLRKLVEQEFIPLLTQAAAKLNESGKSAKGNDEGKSIHRQTVRAVSNAIWKRAQNKSNSIQDELHANSLYTCLCGDVDNKSLDCFGAALLVVIGMNILGFNKSTLTLSEDHAYESHVITTDDGGNSGNTKRATCEVAIPGNNKAAQSKRGQEISYTFEQLKRDNITAETSWLYMANNPVLCENPGMALAALVANLNCDIDKQKPATVSGKPQIVSHPLYHMKRDMLWVLEEANCMARFPFALMELGECEEHVTSQKGMEWVDVSELLNGNDVQVLRNEKLFLDAIEIGKREYNDSQVYPYLYAGHYHKDAGRDDQSEEYRLVEALRLYAEAARVASSYRYDTKDCMQLMKHFTTVAQLMVKDIFCNPQNNNEGSGKFDATSRKWQRRDNAISAATWMIGFFDSLLFWEEKEQNTFVEVLNIQHKHSAGKMFQLFPVDIRSEAIAKIHSSEGIGKGSSAILENQLIYFCNPRSKRLARDSLLVSSLLKEKVVVRELEMALPPNGEGRSRRQRKKARV